MPDIRPSDFVRLPDGTLVENDVLRIAERIDERYGDKVIIRYIPPENGPGIKDPPYIICEWVECLGSYQKIFDVWVLDERVLTTLEEMDQIGKKSADILRELEAKEKKIKEDADKKYRDWADNEAKPLIAAAFKNDKAFTFKTEDGKIVKLHG
jgi:hypothetical protein